jgi:AcrR family transcriptional regulator
MTDAPVSTSVARRVQYGAGNNRKGKETRLALTRAARTIFARDGFVHARIADIAAEAQVAHGTFYTYFESKEKVLVEILNAVDEEVRAAVAHSTDDVVGDTLGNLERATRRYLEAYNRNADMCVLLEQLVGINPIIRETRTRSRREHVKRVAGRIAALQKRGVATAEVNPETAAEALVSMLSNYCYWKHVCGESQDLEESVHTLVRLWAGAIGINSAPGRKNVS